MGIGKIMCAEYVVIGFFPTQYTREDLEYMIPGIIHRYFDGSNKLFLDLVGESINTAYAADKGTYMLQTAYYETMADVIGAYLVKLGHDHLLRKMLLNNNVVQAEIFPINNDILIKWEPRVGRDRTYEV